MAGSVVRGIWQGGMVCALLLGLAVRGWGMEYFVSPAGNDGWSGRVAAPNAAGTDGPFRTLARAATALQPGDTCTLRAGVYRETLRPIRSGTAEQPITIRAFPDERALLHGADPLTGWRDEGDGRWSAPLGWDLQDETQLFAGEAMLTEARWPADTSLLEPKRAVATAGTANTLTDPAIPGDAGAWTGALLWCAGGAKWICWAARVTAYDPATHTLTFDPPQPTHWYTPGQGSAYVLMGVRAALTAPNTWWFDRANGRVWLRLPPGQRPEPLPIAAKARRTLIDLAGRQYIHLQGLALVGGGIATDAQSADLRLDGLRGSYLAHSYLRDVSAQAVNIAGTRIVVTNCAFAYSSGSVLRVAGRENAVVNCALHHGNYGALWSGAVALAGRRQVFSHNTLAHSGRDLLTIHGLMESLIEYNDLSCAGWLTHDLGMTYGHNTDFAGTEIRYNLVHDNKAQGLAQGIYFDHLSHNVLVHHNLIWNVTGMPVQLNNPSFFNLIAHNSAWNTGAPTGTFDHSHRDDLYGTRFCNNLFNQPFRLPAHVALAGNVIAGDPGYTAPDKGDFTLRADAPCRGKGVALHGLADGPAPDPGALPAGHPAWRAGHDFAHPPATIPAWQRPAVQYLNQLINSAFEFGTLEGWTLTGARTAALVPGNGWGNSFSAGPPEPTGTNRFTCELGDGENGLEQTTDPLRPRTRYRLSAWVKTAPGVTIALEVADPPTRTTSTSAAWTRLTVEFTTGEAAAPVTIRLRKTTPGAGHAWCDNCGLVEVEE